MQGMISPLRIRVVHFLLAAAMLPLHGVAQAEPSRAELLYTTHCIGCHTEQVHWRDRRLAYDWVSLSHQVDRWQNLGQLRWTKEDIDAVTAYLNQRHYHFPRPGGQPAMLDGAHSR